MTFKEKFNISNDASFETMYDTIIDNLGYETIKTFLPASIDKIRECLKTDEHLNNIPIKEWDLATGFIPCTNPVTKVQEYKAFGTNTLANFCRKNGINSYSVSELVSILKRCAVRYAQETSVPNN